MSSLSFSLGQVDDLKILFSYPNIPDEKEKLSKTMEHWMGQTLERDGLNKKMVSTAQN